MKDNKSAKIFLVNCDWRDVFRTKRFEFIEKLDRDRLGSKLNKFFVFSWAKVSYEYLDEKDNLNSVHKKTNLNIFRPALDLFSFFYIPFIYFKYKVNADALVSYDFNSIPALYLIKFFSGRKPKIILCINNQPKIYSATRRFGFIKSGYSFLMERVLKYFIDSFFTINSTMVDYILSLGIRRDKIFVFAMNTIDRDMDFIKVSTKGEIRKKYGLGPNDKMLMTVARLEYEKNHSELLNLFSKLPENYHLFLLGMGRLESDLRKQCDDLGISKRVIFTGFVERKDIWNYYNDADLFILLSKAEALGVVFWEAMYMNVPVIGSNVDGILESIGLNNERGFIWKSSMTDSDFIRAITNAVNKDSETIKRMELASQYVKREISNSLTINSII
jgi:glycosyltransferase involved in cell wall biosynthesis